MKKSGLIVLFFMVIVATWSIEACNNGRQSATEDSVDEAKEANDSSKVIGVNETEAKFTVNAAGRGMAEVEIAKLGKQKAINQSVKDFAVKLETEYNKANEALKTLAARKNISLPAMLGEDAQKTITELTQKKGTEFDKGFINKMIEDHQQMIDLFENESRDGIDTNIKVFAGRRLLALYKYLEEAKAIKDKIN